MEHFVERRARELGLRSTPVLASGAIDRLIRYDWPGNVRELANVVERALIQSDGKHLTFDDIVAPSRRSEHPDAVAVAFDDGHAPLDGSSHDAAQAMPAHLKLDEVEARHIRQVMEMTGGKIEGKNGAATVLGMNPATLRYRMQKLGISFGRGKGAAEKGK